ncbi:hypothetical protein ACRAWF_30685 [Streptomyces sp. L7]
MTSTPPETDEAVPTAPRVFFRSRGRPEVREEGRREGRLEGLREVRAAERAQIARASLILERPRTSDVPDTLRQHILANRDYEQARHLARPRLADHRRPGPHR